MKPLSDLLPNDIAGWLMPSLYQEPVMIDALPEAIEPDTMKVPALRQFIDDLVTKGRDEVAHSLLSHPDIQDALDYDYSDMAGCVE